MARIVDKQSIVHKIPTSHRRDLPQNIRGVQVSYTVDCSPQPKAVFTYEYLDVYKNKTLLFWGFIYLFISRLRMG